MLTLILAATLTLPPQKSDAVIGVAAIDLQSGQRISIRGDERFPMGSVYKVPIALEVLRTQKLDRVITIEPADFSPGWSPLRDAAKGKPIVMTVEELAEAMVKLSDNTACDALLRIVTPQAVTKLMSKLIPKGIRVDRQEREMAADLRKPGGRERYASDPRDTATPNAMLGLFTSIAKDRPEKLMRWMTETTTGPKRIKAGLPKGTVVAHKTGTMPGTTNDVAIIDGRYIIVIFTKASKITNEEVEPDIAAVARTAYEALTTR
jgi:beta-lactamase class A